MKEVSVRGEQWFPSEKSFSEELSEFWGNWYCDSEVDRNTVIIGTGARANNSGAEQVKEVLKPSM
jgi:N-dimethylarginine dimethylaminohydrolase